MLNEAFTFEKLLKAYKKCRLGKQHKKEVINFEINLGVNIAKLLYEINNKTYKLGKYKKFTIFEPKERKIEALPFKDRVVIMAFCNNILEKKLDKCLIYDNVACRKGKGTHFGIKRLEGFLRKYYNKFGSEGYFLKCDVSKYFQSIDHKILLNKLSKTELDEQDLQFVSMILDSNNQSVGLPIGNQSSQWFAIFYLNTLDRFIKEKLRIKYYVRYMDDMILVHNDKSYLKNNKKQIQNLCINDLKLSLNSKTQIGKLSNGIDFLGFRHILTKTGAVKRYLRKQAKYRLKKRLKLLGKIKKYNLADEKFVLSRLNSYYAHLCHSNSLKLFYLQKKKNNLN